MGGEGMTATIEAGPGRARTLRVTPLGDAVLAFRQQGHRGGIVVDGGRISCAECGAVMGGDGALRYPERWLARRDRMEAERVS